MTKVSLNSYSFPPLMITEIKNSGAITKENRKHYELRIFTTSLKLKTMQETSMFACYYTRYGESTTCYNHKVSSVNQFVQIDYYSETYFIISFKIF